MGAAVLLVLGLVGGKTALVLAPLLASLLAAHSLGAAGTIIAASTITQRVAAANLAIKLAPLAEGATSDVVDLLRAIAEKNPQHFAASDNQFIARMHGGPSGWGRSPAPDGAWR